MLMHSMSSDRRRDATQALYGSKPCTSTPPHSFHAPPFFPLLIVQQLLLLLLLLLLLHPLFLFKTACSHARPIGATTPIQPSTVLQNSLTLPGERSKAMIIATTNNRCHTHTYTAFLLPPEQTPAAAKHSACRLHEQPSSTKPGSARLADRHWLPASSLPLSNHMCQAGQSSPLFPPSFGLTHKPTPGLPLPYASILSYRCLHRPGLSPSRSA